jgi:uncharacterized Zn finger protein (UPF0148 family)
MLTIQCPACRRSLFPPEGERNQDMQCPACGKTFKLRSEDETGSQTEGTLEHEELAFQLNPNPSKTPQAITDVPKDADSSSSLPEQQQTYLPAIESDPGERARRRFGIGFFVGALPWALIGLFNLIVQFDLSDLLMILMLAPMSGLLCGIFASTVVGTVVETFARAPKEEAIVERLENLLEEEEYGPNPFWKTVDPPVDLERGEGKRSAEAHSNEQVTQERIQRPNKEHDAN